MWKLFQRKQPEYTEPKPEWQITVDGYGKYRVKSLRCIGEDLPDFKAAVWFNDKTFQSEFAAEASIQEFLKHIELIKQHTVKEI